MTATSETFAGGRYPVERRLGDGGMATVYLAHDRELDRPVAIKVLGAHLRRRPSSLGSASGARPRSSARLATRTRSDLRLGEDEDRLYIVMEYVEGESLAAPPGAERARSLSRQAVELAQQACLGARATPTASGVVHRDVKPANLLLERDGMLKVADFGIARSDQETAHTQAGTVLGTAAYLAPEQAAGEPLTPRRPLLARRRPLRAPHR